MSGLYSTNMRGSIKVNEGERGAGLDMSILYYLSLLLSSTLIPVSLPACVGTIM